jgi:hypothetical protein
LLLWLIVVGVIVTEVFCEDFMEVVIRVKDVDVKGIEVSMVDKDVATVVCELDSEYIYKTLIGCNIN